MHSMVRTIGILGLAFFGSACVLAILIGSTVLLTTYGKHPANFIPGDDIVLLLHNPTQYEWEYWRDHFPALDDLAYHEELAAVALLQDETLAHFFKSPFEPEKTAGVGYRKEGAYHILVSPEASSQRFGEQERSLQTVDTYHQLARTKQSDDAFAFVDLTAISLEGSLLELFPPKIPLILVEVGENSIAIQELQTDPVLATPSSIKMPRDTVLTLSSVDIDTLYNNFLSLLSDEKQILLQSILQQAVASALGADTSVDFDLLSLLQNQAAVHFFNTEHGTAFILEGQIADHKEISAALEHLHTSFAHSLPQIRINQRLFDGQFPSKDVRIDPSVIETEQRSPTPETSLHITRHTETQQELATITSENHFAISNNTKALEARISGSGDVLTFPMEESLPRSIPTAAGSIDTHRWRTFQREHLPFLPQGFHPLLQEHTSARIHWFVRQRGDIRTIEIEIEESA